MAARDEIIAFAAELLDLGSFRDYGPQGLQVVGAEEVTRVVCAVSSSLELFQQAAEAGAQLVIVHHGVLWENESRVIDRRVRRRLETLFDADINLAGYHLALDAHPEIGNNALLARELGVEVDGPFMELGIGGHTAQRLEDLLARVRERINPDALAFAHGSGTVEPRRDRLRRRGEVPDRRRSPGLRRLHHRRAGRAEPGPRARAGHHLRRRRPPRDRDARRPGADREASQTASTSSGRSSTFPIRFELVASREYSQITMHRPEERDL